MKKVLIKSYAKTKLFFITVLFFCPVLFVSAESVALDNYLAVDTIQDLLVAILNIVMILMVPIIVFFIILAGFKYVTARGNASQVEEATRALTYAIIGGVLVLGAVALSEIIKNVVDQF
jgi:cytochrome bd-type quinol oxidase subunit 2